MTYTVTNMGAATPPTMPTWDDLIYFSADANLDLKADATWEWSSIRTDWAPAPAIW